MICALPVLLREVGGQTQGVRFALGHAFCNANHNRLRLGGEREMADNRLNDADGTNVCFGQKRYFDRAPITSGLPQ